MAKLSLNFQDKWLRLSDFRGKFVFLDFWATWCAPCLNELPNLKKLHQSFPERDLTIIGLAHDDPRDVEDFVRIHEIPYPNGVSNKEQVPAIRGVYLDLDKDTRLVSISIDPRKVRERRSLMEFVGAGKDPEPDVSTRHDDYLAMEDPHGAAR